MRCVVFLAFLASVGYCSAWSHCYSRGQCAGLPGDPNCYSPDQEWYEPSYCATYRCAVYGSTYSTEAVYGKRGCKVNGVCRRNGETWYTYKGFYCMRYTCTVWGNSARYQGDSVPCSGTPYRSQALAAKNSNAPPGKDS